MLWKAASRRRATSQAVGAVSTAAEAPVTCHCEPPQAAKQSPSWLRETASVLLWKAASRRRATSQAVGAVSTAAGNHRKHRNATENTEGSGVGAKHRLALFLEAATCCRFGKRRLVAALQEAVIASRRRRRSNPLFGRGRLLRRRSGKQEQVAAGRLRKQ